MLSPSLSLSFCARARVYEGGVSATAFSSVGHNISAAAFIMLTIHVKSLLLTIKINDMPWKNRNLITNLRSLSR